VSRHGVRVTLRPDAAWNVQASMALLEELSGLLGEENVVLRPLRREANGRNGYRRPNAHGAAARAGQAGGDNGQASPAVTRFN
jgi:hypothetical protein